MLWGRGDRPVGGCSVSCLMKAYPVDHRGRRWLVGPGRRVGSAKFALRWAAVVFVLCRDDEVAVDKVLLGGPMTAASVVFTSTTATDGDGRVARTMPALRAPLS